MRTVPLSPTAQVRRVPASSFPLDSAAAESIPAAGGVRRQSIDGLRWVFHDGFDSVLRRVMASAWQNPDQQGWERIKSNSARDVWRARIQGRTYYLKYYASHGWMTRVKAWLRGPVCKSEWSGGLFALRAGIPAVRPAGYTPRLMYRGRAAALLVTAALERSVPLNEFWPSLNADPSPARRRRDVAALCELLGQLIAQAHQAGFEHMDMHAANVLIQTVAPREYRAAFVDLHSARRDTPLSDGAVVRNLAQLNQWFRRASSVKDRLRFLRAYLRWRDHYEATRPHGRRLELNFRQLVDALSTSAERHAQRLWAKRDRRMWRNGRYYTRVRLGDGWLAMVFVCAKHADDDSRASSMQLTPAWWKEQLRNPLRLFSSDAGASLKTSHSAQVRRYVLDAPAGSLPVIAKRPLSRNWMRWLAARLGPSRSRRGWRMGQSLLHRDLPTARPLAVLERRIGPVCLDCLLITEAMPGALDLHALLVKAAGELGSRDWFRLKRLLVERLAIHIRRFEERGFVHRDLKAQNILVIPHQDHRLMWIDMDGVRLSGRGNWLRSLVRLHVSLLEAPGLTRTDRVRFLKAFYARFGRPADSWRRTWRAAQPLVEAKLRAQRARRAWKLRHYGRI